MTTREEVWVTCEPCNHTWIAVYLPMEMAKAARIMAKSVCPRCGGRKLVVSSDADIIAARRQQALDAIGGAIISAEAWRK